MGRILAKGWGDYCPPHPWQCLTGASRPPTHTPTTHTKKSAGVEGIGQKKTLNVAEKIPKCQNNTISLLGGHLDTDQRSEEQVRPDRTKQAMTRSAWTRDEKRKDKTSGQEQRSQDMSEQAKRSEAKRSAANCGAPSQKAAKRSEAKQHNST